MHNTLSLVGGAGLGAGLMYFLDPDRGRRRRALMRDKSIRWSRKTREFAGSTPRDMRNRAQGMGAAVKSWVQPEPPVPDHVLAERIRSKLGMFSRHPSAIDVHVTDGTATISGPVLQDEIDGICGAIDKIPGVSRGVRNRAQGMGAAVKSWVQPEPPVPDHVLAERIRSKLGMFSRHPSAIDVHVTDGTATISGPVLQDEIDGICGAIAKIPGVKQIFNRLEPHASPADVPALQGPMEGKPGPRYALMQSHWSPTARMAAAIMGTAALLYGLNQRTVSAATLAASGFGLLIRSATNEEFSRLFNFRIGTISGL